jgi:large subunit ribosomal protein L25
MVTVRCLPTDVPEGIDLDVSGLGIGDSLRIEDLSSEGDFEFIQDPDTVVVTIAQPVSEEELAAMEADAGVVGEEPTVEGEEAATGATEEESDGSGEPSVSADPGAEKEPS